MKIIKSNLYKPSFLLSCLLLVWFFVPGEWMGWTRNGHSGFGLVWNEMAFALIPIPICAIYLIMGNLTGDLALETYAKRGILISIFVFVVMMFLSTYALGFLGAVLIGAFLWWETLMPKL